MLYALAGFFSLFDVWRYVLESFRQAGGLKERTNGGCVCVCMELVAADSS